MLQFILNEQNIDTDLPSGMTMLDFVRYHQHLTGTKIGCREGDCGACTILVGELINNELHYQSMTSCLMPIANAAGKHIVTIEGINFPDGLNPIQQAMADEGATQCGFCTPGFIVSLAGFCLGNQAVTKENAIAAVDGNICRCTGYKSIERAAYKIADLTKTKNNSQTIDFLTSNKILPAYFSTIKNRLEKLQNETLPLPEANTKIVGGGTDLYVQQHDKMTTSASHYFFDNKALKNITIADNICTIGASVTVAELLSSPIINKGFPSFPQYAKLVSSTPIRNMATIAGNIVNASPIGDFTVFLLALNAKIVLSDGVQKRNLPLQKLYKGYKDLDKKTEEFIEAIEFVLPDENTYFNFEKISKRTHLDIASVNTAVSLQLKNEIIETIHLSAGGVGPIPMYLAKTIKFLEGKNITEKNISEAIEVMWTEISPISDARGTKEYKTLLLGQLIKAHFIQLFPQQLANKIIV
ncbi:MAG: FAD binding domain-containing protein [Chitinophagaceae bacterium]|nr:FAD binding domain-containing protein [Chitinophagaceae bacterium]